MGELEVRFAGGGGEPGRAVIRDGVDGTMLAGSLSFAEARRQAAELSLRYVRAGERPDTDVRRKYPPVPIELQLTPSRVEQGLLLGWVRGPDGWYAFVHLHARESPHWGFWHAAKVRRAER